MACPGRRSPEALRPITSEHPVRPPGRSWWWLLPIGGLISLVWFVVRVIPKPSRAAYPCQKVAAPLAGGFLLWIGGVVGSAFAFRRARALLRTSRLRLALACLALAVLAGIVALYYAPDRMLTAANPEPNAPIGVAKGVHPGRVAWVHNPGATDWQGPGYGHWWEAAHTSQTVVESMMGRAIRCLTGQPTDAAAWNSLFRYFNSTHSRGDVGYIAGEKICIKINLVGCIYNSWGGVDPASYNLVGKVDYMNTSPQVMVSLLRQLVNVVGVNQADISMGDPLSRFPNQYYDICHVEFPDVHYFDHEGGVAGHPRVKSLPSTTPFYWSDRVNAAGKTQDYIPVPYAEATYFIDLANFKSHTSAGVTLCAKNHFGSLGRTPPEPGYFDMHASLPNVVPGMGHYRSLVDLLGYGHTGGKAVLYLIDGLYSGKHPDEESPRKWNTAPFNGDWTSSLFASEDPVAIDSVAYDFLWTEWTSPTHMSGGDDYLHEAALANSPLSGTFYDPDHATNTVRMASLGTHEHWNNASDRKYSRNLGSGNGIELVKSGWPVALIDAVPVSGRAPLAVQFDGSRSFDTDGTIVSYQWDFENDGIVDASGPAVSHTYGAVGDYIASLVVLSSTGYTDIAKVTITVERQAADFDGDYDVDQQDFGFLQACMTGSGGSMRSGCEDADLDHDTDVDTQDAAIFQRCLSGSGREAEADCGT
jgi:hypothetical protein